MRELIKKGSQMGWIVSIVLFFLILFGLTTTLSEILGDMFKLSSNSRVGNTGGLMIFFGLLGLWAGLKAAAEDKTNWKSALISGVSAGLVIGLVIGAFIFLVGFLDAADVEMRDYFVQFSRPAVQFLLYGQGILTGPLITFGIFDSGAYIKCKVKF